MIVQDLRSRQRQRKSFLAVLFGSGRFTVKVAPPSTHPDPREDLESRSPNLVPYTTKGTL